MTSMEYHIEVMIGKGINLVKMSNGCVSGSLGGLPTELQPSPPEKIAVNRSSFLY